MISALSFVTCSHPPLEILNDLGSREAQAEVEEGRHEQGLRDNEGSRLDGLDVEHDILYADGVADRAFLDDGNEFVGYRRKDVLDGLGDDDMKHGLGLGHTQGPGCFGLSQIYAFNAASDDIRHISAGVQCQGYDAGEETLKLDESEEGELGKGDEAEYDVVDQEDLYQHGGTSDELHVDAGNQLDGIKAGDELQPLEPVDIVGLDFGQMPEGTYIRQEHQGKGKSDDKADDNCQKGQKDCDQKSLPEHGQIFGQLFQVVYADGHKTILPFI